MQLRPAGVEIGLDGRPEGQAFGLEGGVDFTPLASSIYVENRTNVHFTDLILVYLRFFITKEGAYIRLN